MFNRRASIMGTAAVTLVLSVAACGSSSKSASSASPGATGSSSAASCTPKHPASSYKTVSSGTFTVAAYVSPPFTVQTGDAIDGIDGLITQEIAKMECLKLDAKSVAGAALPASITSGRADVAIGGVNYNADRAKIFNYTVPMYEDGVSILSKSTVSSLDALSGKTVGVIQGYLWNTEFQTALGTNNVKIYQTSASLIADIKNGRVFAGIYESAEAGYRVQQDSALKTAVLTPTPKVKESQGANYIYLISKKGTDSLTAVLNDDIKALLSNGFIASALTKNGVDAKFAAKSS